MAHVERITRDVGTYRISVVTDAGDRAEYAYPVDHTGDHTEWSWLEMCCREAVLLADAQAAVPGVHPVDVPIPPEFQHGG